jgi:hypothetical protein
MYKAILLLFLALLPGLLALLGFTNPAGPDAATPRHITVMRLFLINPFIMSMLGGVTALILQHKRVYWVSVVVCFLFAWLALGLVNGNFYTEGVFGMAAINQAALLSLWGFVGSIFTFVLVNLLKKMFAQIEK